ncbi:hemicentin-2-like isoform X1 [Haliotis rufescens]|uniref:hemicentin-2-like isoform X1 n=1 Tax=Haliotis rufescens TaxID=6454 RepID=UPI00201E7F25|nr:hemicentin-2-like isoform X1 [Haliotis rufescens]
MSVQGSLHIVCAKSFMEIKIRHLWIIILISCGARYAESQTTAIAYPGDNSTVSFLIPQGGLGTGSSFYFVTPSGVIAFILTASDVFIATDPYKDRVILEGSYSSRNITFVLKNITRSDAGHYNCSTAGSTSHIPNCGLKLIVIGEPTKPVTSLQSTPVVGRNVTMTCSSTSTTLPADHGLTFTYTWKIDGVNINSPGGASLTVLVESHDPQDITCHVTEDEGLGGDSDVLMITPDYPPYNASISSTSVQVKEADVVPQVTCVSTCRPACSYSWKQGSQTVVTGQVLSLGAANRTMAGSYVCTATNTYGITQSPAVSLDVQYKPSAVLMANGQSNAAGVDERGSVVLSCAVDSNPFSSISIMNGTIRLNHVTEAATASFNWTGADCLDGSVYTCLARNIVGEMTASVTVNIKCSPRLNFQYPTGRDVYVDIGQPIRLQVYILAFPQPTFTWFKQNGGSAEPVDLSKWRQYDEAMTSYIVTDIVEETDYGVYNVNVTNTLGRFRMQFQLGKKAPLSVPENFQCQNKAGSYILQWTPGGDDETRGVGFLVEQRLPQANWTTVSATVASDGMMRQVQFPESGDRTVFFRLYAAEGAARTSPVTASCTSFTVAVDNGELSFGVGVGVGLAVAVAAAAVCLAVVCICRKKRLSLRNDPSRQKEEESVYHEVAASTVTTQHSRQQHRQSGAGTSGSTYDALTSDRDTPTEAPAYEKLEKQYVNMAVSADDET